MSGVGVLGMFTAVHGALLSILLSDIATLAATLGGQRAVAWRPWPPDCTGRRDIEQASVGGLP